MTEPFLCGVPHEWREGVTCQMRAQEDWHVHFWSGVYEGEPMTITYVNDEADRD